MRFIKKYFLWIIAVLISVIFIKTIVFTKNPNIKYEIYQVKRGEISETVSATGKIVPVNTVDLSFAQSGRIKNIFVKKERK